MRIGYPWRTIPQALELELDQVMVDGAELVIPPLQREARRLDLPELVSAPWSVAELSFTTIVPKEDLDATGQSASEVRACLLLHDAASNLRRGSMVDVDQDLKVTGSIVLRSDELAGHADIEIVLTGMVSDVPHREIGRSQSWTIDVDPKRIRPGKAPFTVVWKKFDDPDVEPQKLRAASAAPAYFDFHPDEPVLYLNDSIEYLNSLLNWEKATGLKRSARDLIIESIASKVLTQIAAAAIDDVEDVEGGGYTLGSDSELLGMMMRRLAETMSTVSSPEELMQRAVVAKDAGIAEAAALDSEVAAAVETLCATRVSVARAADRAMND